MVSDRGIKEYPTVSPIMGECWLRGRASFAMKIMLSSEMDGGPSQNGAEINNP